MQFLTTALLGQPRHAEKVDDDFLVFCEGGGGREGGRAVKEVRNYLLPGVNNTVDA